LPLVLYECEA